MIISVDKLVIFITKTVVVVALGEELLLVCFMTRKECELYYYDELNWELRKHYLMINEENLILLISM